METLQTSASKNPRPGSMQLRVFHQPRDEERRMPENFLYSKPARTTKELAGLVQKELRRGVDPRCLMLVKFTEQDNLMKIRWVPTEGKGD